MELALRGDPEKAPPRFDKFLRFFKENRFDERLPPSCIPLVAAIAASSAPVRADATRSEGSDEASTLPG